MVALALAVSMAVRQEVRPLVWALAMDPVSAEKAKTWANVKDRDLLKVLEDEGFTLIRGKRSTYAVDPELQIDDDGSRYAGFLKDMLALRQPNGLLKTPYSKEMREFLNLWVGAVQGKKGAENASFAVGVNQDIFLWDGSREQKLSQHPSLDEPTREALEARSIDQLPALTDPPPTFSTASLKAPLVAKLHLRKLRGFADADAFDAAWEEFGSILRERRQKARARMDDARRDFVMACLGPAEAAAFQGIEKGAPESNLPDWAKRNLDGIVQSYKDFGFDSQEAAVKFRANARVSSTRIAITIVGADGKRSIAMVDI